MAIAGAPIALHGIRVLLALLFAVAGFFHLTAPEPFIRITPGCVPAPEEVVRWTGIAELAGAIGLVQPFSLGVRRAAGVGLALYALCVWPANANHMMMDLARPDGGWGLGYHVPRMLAQPLIVWAALWAGGAIDWPIARQKGPGK